MKKLLDMSEQLSERYLISEVMELPEQAEEQVYYQLLKMAGKSMLEQIGDCLLYTSGLLKMIPAPLQRSWQTEALKQISEETSLLL